MSLSRRSLIAAATALAVAPGLARADEADPRMAERSLGDPEAHGRVMQEWFSLTCTHCAAWRRRCFPR